jgi:hypothetical protein
MSPFSINVTYRSIRMKNRMMTRKATKIGTMNENPHAPSRAASTIGGSVPERSDRWGPPTWWGCWPLRITGEPPAMRPIPRVECDQDCDHATSDTGSVAGVSAAQRCRRGESNSHPELPGLGPQGNAQDPTSSVSVRAARQRGIADPADPVEPRRTAPKTAECDQKCDHAALGFMPSVVTPGVHV